MQVSHQEAQALIQYSLDSVLDADNKNKLSVHLQTCTECAKFKNEMIKLERSLHAHADKYGKVTYTSLPINIFIRKVNSKNFWVQQLTMTSVVFMIIFVSVWQFTQVSEMPIENIPHFVSPIPTPAIHMTNTSVFSQDCKSVNYIIQEGDSLESISIQFNISQELLKNENNLLSADLQSGTKLVIPLCSATPTFTTTFSPTAFLMTYTP